MVRPEGLVVRNNRKILSGRERMRTVTVCKPVETIITGHTVTVRYETW